MKEFPPSSTLNTKSVPILPNHQYSVHLLDWRKKDDVYCRPKFLFSFTMVKQTLWTDLGSGFVATTNTRESLRRRYRVLFIWLATSPLRVLFPIDFSCAISEVSVFNLRFVP